ncbi:MAG: SecD/SecF family protein translocase subunit [Clostridia bacterium]|nr:SecD/SecF family protein translocase subunit [Clostridia bacterium]
MKRTPKWAFFIVTVLILALSYTSLFGVYASYGDRTDTVIRGVGDIRWGIDIRGGVDVTFGPVDENVKPTANQLDGAKTIIEQRLVSKNITDYEAYTDEANSQVIVRFPWANTEETPEEAVKEIGQTAMLAFYIGSETDDKGKPSGKLVLDGDDIESATAAYQATDEQATSYEYVVQLKLKESGKKAFADATKQQAASKGTISIWLDDEMISNPTVNDTITTGEAIISGSFETFEDAKQLADLITSGALPFEIEAKSLGSVSPTMGSNALKAMGIAAAIAMVLVFIMMLVIYRLPGLVAGIALCGQMALSIAAISGYFAIFNSFTMTLPGVAGLILSIGIGVDCNVITAESIRDEIRAGKTIDSAIRSGSKNSFWAIFDGNITVLIVAAVLMGVFGSGNGLFSMLFSWFPPSTTGSVYSFGYTLLIGVITNFIMGIWLSRVMLRSVSRLKIFRNPWLYGGDRA